MIGRQVCWSDPALAKLAEKFVAASDEVWRLQNRKDVDCKFFQGFCEEGHYGGRTRPTGTRQGIYCCTPSGRFLASVNTTDPKRMARMLSEALAAWAKTPEGDRYLNYDPATKASSIGRAEQNVPKDGLLLRVYSRDVPARKASRAWLELAWNVDSLWYRRDEIRELLPKKIVVGAKQIWPEALAQRLIRTGLVDNVRGQTLAYDANHVRDAQIKSEITAINEGVATVRISGSTRASTTEAWPIGGEVASLKGAREFDRGVRTTLLGEAQVQLDKRTITSLAIAVAGTRWGRTRYNFRGGDVDEAPIAFAVRLEPDSPIARVAPAHVWSYGWE